MTTTYDIPSDLDAGLEKGKYVLTLGFSDNPYQWIGAIGLTPVGVFIPRETVQNIVNLNTRQILTDIANKFKNEIRILKHSIKWQDISWGTSNFKAPQEIILEIEVIKNPLMAALLIGGIIALVIAILPEPVLAKIRRFGSGIVKDTLEAVTGGILSGVPWYVYLIAAGVAIIVVVKVVD